MATSARLRVHCILYVWILCLVSGSTPVGAQSAEDFFHEGNRFSREGRYPEAVDAFRESIKLNPKSAVAHYNLGLTYRAMNDTENALGALNKAVEIDPYYWDAHLTLGSMYNSLERWDDAIAHLNLVVHRKPNDPVAHGNLGWAYFNSEKKPPFKYLVVINLKKAVDLFDEQGMTQAAKATRQTLEQAIKKFGFSRKDWLADESDRL